MVLLQHHMLNSGANALSPSADSSDGYARHVETSSPTRTNIISCHLPQSPSDREKQQHEPNDKPAAMESNSHPQTPERQGQPHEQHVSYVPPSASSLLPPDHDASRERSTASPSSPPAGNIDPNLVDPATGQAAPRPVRKRNRKALSCKPCRNMKVKCDRSMPCDRCIKNNRISDCVYDGEPESKKACLTGLGGAYPAVSYEESASGKGAQASESILSKTEKLETKFNMHVRKVGTAITLYRGGKARYVGGSHWVHLFGEFEDFGTWHMADFEASRKEIKFLKKSFKNKQRHNFPFCTSTPISAKDVSDCVPERYLAEMYIKRYLDTFERTHPLLHEPTFQRELEGFWQDRTSVGMPWKASLFMMMFLGCWFTPFTLQSERNHEVLDKLLDGAQACLLSSDFRSKTTLTVVRAYCMVILAKQCDAISHDDSNIVSITMAMITQIAILGGVHRDPDHFKDMPPLEKFMRRRIWNTVLYMNFQNSMDAGMPFLLHPHVYDCSAPLNTNEHEAASDTATRHPSAMVTDNTHQIILRSVIAIGSEIIIPINNANAEILPYDAVMKYDYRLTRILDDLPNALSPEKYTGSRLDYRARLATQRQMIDFFIRSILLILHRPYAQGAESKEQYPNSFYTVLKHSASYISTRKQLFGDSSVNSVNGIWLAEVFKEMFTLSFLFCYLDIRRREDLEFLDDGLGGLSDEKYKCILDSQTMSEQEAIISEHHFQLYLATALKFPSLFMKDRKTIIFSKQYVTNLNQVVQEAARKVRAALKLPPLDDKSHGGEETDGSIISVPGLGATSETIASATPQITTPENPSTSTVRIGPMPEQLYDATSYDAMPPGFFDSLMNEPNLMLDEFFTSFVFGGFQ
ncbi:hypothetical protein Dda_9347 [Drechslerella dactyloides]|uniref:Zn(2)-C6 fungal-type domain-containing protein n=1 Tax=Drechslerella dactyloides TaxID=74499 RepID=A0AAD6IPC3_DREDA|nr:hypothetical protein Dda_9347 [Drechslerella dactyloides]